MTRLIVGGAAVAPPTAADVPRSTTRARRPHMRPTLGAAVELALLAAVGCALFVAGGIVGNPWYRIVSIVGGSMEPTIMRGDLIVVTPAPETIEPGMVLVLSASGDVVTHRVVAVTADGTVVTRGDANRVDDAWANRQVRVIGLYVATIPWLGSVLPVLESSGASFTDATSATMRITVGPWTTPAIPESCFGMTFDEVVVGTDADDTVTTGNGRALVFGLAGSDTITGGNAMDCLVGGEGSDTLSGGNGRDVLLGDEGDDVVNGGRDADVLQGGGGSDLLDGGHGKDLLDGGDGTDACYGTGRDTLVGCETMPTDAPVRPESEPTPVPDASAGPDDDASPSPTPEPTPGPDASPSPAAVPDPNSSPTPEPEPSPAPTPEPEPSPSPTPEPEPSPAPTPEPEPSPSPTPEASASRITGAARAESPVA